MTALTFSLIVILIAAPLCFLFVMAQSEKENGPLLDLLVTSILVVLTLSVAWGIRLICLHFLPQ